MKNFKDFLNNGISDELLAAYIDGNTTESENSLIENTLNGDTMLAEAYEIASDSVSFGNNSDWELYKGDLGFLELGLPPVIDALNMVSQEQGYGSSFDNNNELLSSESFPLPNDLSGDNNKFNYDDTPMPSDMGDLNW